MYIHTHIYIHINTHIYIYRNYKYTQITNHLAQIKMKTEILNIKTLINL